MWQKLSYEEFLSKAKAVVVGHAVADAVGVPYENSWRRDLDKDPAVDMVGGGYYDMPRGSWSDDTSMSLCTLDAIAKAGDDAGELRACTLANFRSWLQNSEFTPTELMFDCGITCANAIEQGYGETDVRCNGNGSLMRIHPYVLKNFYDINLKGEADIPRCLEFVADGSGMTHAHPRSVLACLLYAGILTKLLISPQKSSVQEGLKAAVDAIYATKDGESLIYDFVRRELEEKKTYKRVFDGIENVPRDNISSSGYVVDTFEAAIWSLMTTSSYRECVLAAVNLGRDTDTVAAIAGGLAGALYGYDAIPADWREGLLKRDYIESLCASAFPAF